MVNTLHSLRSTAPSARRSLATATPCTSPCGLWWQTYGVWRPRLSLIGGIVLPLCRPYLPPNGDSDAVFFWCLCACFKRGTGQFLLLCKLGLIIGMFQKLAIS